MNSKCHHVGGLLLALIGLSSAALAQFVTGPVERKLAYSEAQVSQALVRIGAYAGSRLPTLDGFVVSGTNLARLSRPYYDFEIELLPVAGQRTELRIKAKITAMYADPKTLQSEYRPLLSNGRLEADLLDRLQEALRQLAPTIDGGDTDPAGLDAQIASLQSARADLEKTARELRSKIQTMESATQEQTTRDLVRVAALQAIVRARPAEAAQVLLKSNHEDMFEVVQQQGDWVRVRLGPNSAGWVERAQLAPVDERAAAAALASSPDAQPEFDVSREEVNLFSGDWAALKGKKALFVYAQPRGVLPSAALAQTKLAYAKQVFAERYRQAIHSQHAFSGVVVIFLGGNGGIAAATFKDIQQWVEGGLADDAFMKRCSLDPPELFRHLQNR